MLTIKVGKRRIKLLNWIIFISFIIFIVYILGLLFFMIPVFKKTYNHKLVKENYEINSTTSFKNIWFTCKVKEEYVISSKDKDVYNTLEKDLINEGFTKKKDKLVRIDKNFGICKDEREEYNKTHSKNFVNFNLNGEKEETVIYGNDYNDLYVTAKVDKKDVKDIDISSNVNKNKIGKYIVSYSINVSNNYKQRLYRIVNVIDEEKPVISLLGEKDMVLDYGISYKEPGFTATDNYDGDITGKVSVKNPVNTRKAGTYKITYKVKDSSNNVVSEERIVTVKEKEENVTVNKEEPKIEVKDGITYVNGILLVNKTYSLPKDYDPKVNKTALKALKDMQADAKAIGLDLSLISGYRSYKTQEKLYNKYVKKDGEAVANTYSAKPGHSEHQTGLAFDIGRVDSSFANTDEAKWLEKNAHLYGFIVRYPKDKTDITGYIYEPWHVRYLGKENAKKVWESGLTLEEYLGVN